MFRLLRLIALTAVIAAPAMSQENAKVVSFYGYDDCIQLTNETIKATLCPAAGARVLEYSLNGKNVLYLPPGDEGWRLSKDSGKGNMNAGRFDIGPEKMVKRGPLLWMGEWKGEVTGKFSARLTSQVDPVSGVQLIRDFELAGKSSRLICTQTIHNVSQEDVNLCHWSRTFAVGKGIAVIPRSPLGRFPNGYVMYKNGREIDIIPEDPNIQVTDTDITIKAAPEQPKLGFDSMSGWFAYFAPTDQLFVKRFRTYPDRSYNEALGLTVSVWYPKDRDTVELEPIGPAEMLAPGQKASFAEEWWLLDHTFPKSGDVDAKALRELVTKHTTEPN